MGHRRYVPHCQWRNAIAVFMAAVTAGAWIPFVTDPYDAVPADDEEEFSVPAPIFEAHGPITWPEQAVPRPVVSLVKTPKPVKSPSSDPAYSKPTPKIAVTYTPHPPVAVPVQHPVTHLSDAQILVIFLRAQVGERYVFGGNGPDVWDCSGLTKAAFRQIGVYLPRTSQAQSLRGTPVSISRLQVGDLVFWGAPGLATHVGVYIGSGRIIAAQNPLRGVIEFNVSYFPPSFARRVL